MKFKNRFTRMATALAIVGIVAAQIPSRPSVSMAADGYREGERGLFGLSGAGSVVAGAVAAGALYGAVTGGGSSVLGGGLAGAPSLYDTLAGNPNFSHIKAILDAAGIRPDQLANMTNTIFFPSNQVLEALMPNYQSIIGNQQLAKSLIDDLTLMQKVTLDSIKTEIEKTGTADFPTVGGSGMQFKMDGNNIIVTRALDKPLTVTTFVDGNQLTTIRPGG